MPRFFMLRLNLKFPFKIHDLGANVIRHFTETNADSELRNFAPENGETWREFGIECGADEFRR